MNTIPRCPCFPHLVMILVFSVLLLSGCRSPSETSRSDDPAPSVAENAAPAPQGNVVQINDGRIRGCRTTGSFPGGAATDVWTYKNIPYAATTAGANRWRLAQPPTPWGNHTRNATYYGQPCSQLSQNPDNPRTLLGSDDCLTVNVFTPVGPPATPGEVPARSLPVMVFIHGGSYRADTGGSPLYDGSNLAGGGGVVVVTMNYRLGVLGFLAGIEAGDVRNGNLGLKDQQQALRWVRDNVRYFGGDKDQVTVFGESAGASSVGVHLVNAESMQLLARGIMESNHYGMMFQTRETAAARAKKLLRTFDCSGDADQQLSCLRAAADADLREFLIKAGPDSLQEVEALLCQAFGGFEYWAPMIDGDFVHRQPTATVITRPVMMGTNTNEGVLFPAIPGMYPDVEGGAITLTAFMKLIFGPVRGAEVLVHYPDLINPSEHKGVPLAKVFTDFIWNCANNQVLNAAVTAGNRATYSYYFTHVPTITIYPMGYTNGAHPKPFVGNYCGPDPAVKPVHLDNVCHGNEIPYVFGNPFGYTLAGQQTMAEHAFEDNENPMIATIMGLWTDFAKNGAPGGGFPRFDDAPRPAGSTWVLNERDQGGFTATSKIYDESKCDFWQHTVQYKLSWLQELCTSYWGL